MGSQSSNRVGEVIFKTGTETENILGSPLSEFTLHSKEELLSVVLGPIHTGTSSSVRTDALYFKHSAARAYIRRVG